MKSFVCLSLFVVIASMATASSVVSPTSLASSDSKQDLESDLKPVHSSQLHSENNRFRKSAAYGGPGNSHYGVPPSVPAPPCPKNYLFSCQPNLAPVPCSAPANSYGSVGAYSAPVPTYVAALQNTYGLPQGYGGFVPQNFNHFYHY